MLLIVLIVVVHYVDLQSDAWVSIKGGLSGVPSSDHLFIIDAPFMRLMFRSVHIRCLKGRLEWHSSSAALRSSPLIGLSLRPSELNIYGLLFVLQLAIGETNCEHTERLLAFAVGLKANTDF